MAKKFRYLVARKAPAWHAAVAAQKRKILSENLAPRAERSAHEKAENPSPRTETDTTATP